MHYLMDNGADVNKRGPEASSVLHLVARSGNEELLRNFENK